MVVVISVVALLLTAISSPFAFAAISSKGDLVIANKIIAPDGFKRSTILANGEYPGPLIKLQKGNSFKMNVINKLTDDGMLRTTSINWHGMHQKNTNYADGVVGVNQCPIAPGDSFCYEFSTDHQTGTRWYHSFDGNQYCDGLRGPIVIYDPEDPHKDLYDVDDESTVITLSDWYHVLSEQAFGIVDPDSTLINGKGRYFNGPHVDLAVINVQEGKRYRFRLISMSCSPNFIFSIDGHSLTIIEADGQNTTPLKVDSIQIFAAQRYSVILHACQPIGNYWIRALPNAGHNLTTFDNGLNSAILRYKGAPYEDPNSKQNPAPVLLDESALSPLENSKAPGNPWPGGADVNIHLNLALDETIDRFLINSVSYMSPPVPVLLQILSGAQTAHDLLPAGSVYTLPRNKTVEISFSVDAAKGPHPFHMHGHDFSVIKSAGNDTSYDFDTPVRRDTVSTGTAGSNVTIRFVTDNAGPWLLHCHIIRHYSAGFGVVLAEDTIETKQLDHVPSAWDELCPRFNELPFTATAVRDDAAATPV